MTSQPLSLTEEQIRALEVKVSQAFRPAAPIDRSALFAGRTEQIRTVLDALTQRGQHVVIYGERGVGKTSLANILFDLLTQAGVTGIIAPKIHCDASDDFGSVWVKLFQEIEVSLPIRQAGYLPGTELKKFSLAQTMDAEQKINPHLIRRILRQLDQPAILIVDEFDRLTDTTVPRLFADTIKALSDYATRATLVIVGVAKDIDELIVEHASIDRALIQIKLPRMSDAELMEILDKGAQESGISIPDEIKKRVAALSKGLPHYTHLLGLYSARQALNNRRKEVTPEDLRQAISVAVDRAQQSIRTKYQQAVAATKDSLYPQVLLACALAKHDALGTFNAPAIRDAMTGMTGQAYRTSQFYRHLIDFCSQDRGNVLEKSGHRKKYRYAFTDPLMQPFVILHGFATRLLPEEQVRRLVE